MSRKILRKQSSYSQFRKQNSLNKFGLNHSVLDVMDTSMISLIADQKTSQLLSMENQLQSLVKNRSFSAMPSVKISIPQTTKPNVTVMQETLDQTLQIMAKDMSQCGEQVQDTPKAKRSVLYQSFTEAIQVIEETQVYNEEDNTIAEEKQLNNNKNNAKAQIKSQKNTLAKRKGSIQLVKPIKIENKATIKDLQQMQRRLESVKKAKKFVGRDPQIKKTEIIPKKTPTNSGFCTQRRVQKTFSEAHLTSENLRLKGLDVMKQKQLASKARVTKRIPFSDSSKLATQNERVLIPTKMVNLEQKQKLLRQFDKIKEAIKHTDISADNMTTIKSMIKTMEGLIN